MYGNPSNNSVDGPVTVEAEYDLPDRATSMVNKWTFEKSPQEAKDAVLAQYVPPEATMHRICLWSGGPDDRPSDDNDSEFL